MRFFSLKSFLASFFILLCVNAYAQTPDPTHPEITDPNPNVTLATKKGVVGSLQSAIANPANAADVVFTFGTNTIDVLFHNPTEAGWFLQLLKQIGVSSSTTKIVISLKSGQLLPSNGKTDISNYLISADSIQNLTIASVASDQVIVDNTQIAPIVSIPSVVNDKMDPYTDRIRDALEKVGYWFGKEGKHDHP